jgi:adenosyl cobinamide kinase/adenosyl cobinamide phosphate guanylyltransferase
MTRAPIPATRLAPTKELENPPTAAEVVEVEFAADEVLVVDPLTSWLTTETTTLEELAHEAPERILALLLKVMSAHCCCQQPDLIVRNPI